MKSPNLIYDKENNILLKKTDVTGYVCGEFVEFSINYVYENKGSNDVEAVFTFPIPETAVLSGFEANIGGRIIKTSIECRDEANNICEKLKEEGTNLLLEEINTNDFKICIGKIISGESINLKISYIEELEYDDESLKLTIPQIIEPMSVNNSKNLINENDYKCYLNLLVEPFNEVEFESPTHNIAIEKGDGYIYKVYFDKEEYLDRDLVIYITEKELEETTGMIYENEKDDSNILYLRFIPDIEEEEEELSHKYEFLVDISDSMEGDKLLQAKNALQICLRNLEKGDSFNIIAMGDKLHCFNDSGKVPYNEENLIKASKFIDELECEDDAVIFEGLKYAFRNEESGKENTIFLFTDDIVDDEKEILDYVEAVCENSRIFPFGIDASVNTYFINKLAQVTYGKAEYINDKNKIEDTILRQFNKIRGLQITDIKLDFGDMNVEKTYPRTIEYMYDGEPFSIFAKVKGSAEGVVTLTGMVGDRRVQRRINLNNLELEENANLIEKVWYKKRCKSIENRIRFERGEIYNSMKNKLIELSKEVGVLTSETSFILIEEVYDPVLNIAFKKFLPANIRYEESEYSDDVCGFYYRNFLNKDFTDATTKEMLRILASHQYASGAFSNSMVDSEDEKLLCTTKSFLAFTMIKEDINIYKKLLNKSLSYIKDAIGDDFESYDDEILSLSYLALDQGIRKNIIKNDKKDLIKKYKEDIEEVLKNRNISIESIKENLKKEAMENSEDSNTLESLVNKLISQ